MYVTACDLEKFVIFDNKKSQSNLGRAASPPLTAENNYATRSLQLLQWDVPHLPPKLQFPLRRYPPPFNTSIPRLTPPTIPDGMQIESAILPQCIFRIDTQTDKPVGDLVRAPPLSNFRAPPF